jgi:NAD(P)-dependent dehydrogenase (short-subunit alcohol dehydrogenase family)
MKVQGKTIVVTGGGSGMGRELVLLLLKKGARVAAVDINETTLAETANLAGYDKQSLSTHVINIADREAVYALPDAVMKAHGPVDGLINNAGIIQRFVRVKDLEQNEIERVFNVNFWGTLHMVKAFLPHLLAAWATLSISSMGSTAGAGAISIRRVEAAVNA